MLKKTGHFILGHPLYAAVIVMLLVLYPFMSLFFALLAATIVAMVTLEQGPKSGAFLLFWLLAPAVATLFFRQFSVYDVEWLFCVLVYGLAVMLGQYGSWRLVLEALLVVGVVVLLAVHLLNHDIAAWWQSHMLALYHSSSLISTMSPAEIQHLDHSAALYAKTATGVFSFYVMLLSLCVLMLGRFWQSVMVDSTKAFGEEMRNIRMTRWFSLIVLLCFAGFVLQLPLFVDGFFMAIMPVVVAGFSYLHTIKQSRSWFGYVLPLIYIGLIVFQYLVAPAVAAIGLADASLNFRKRFVIQKKKINTEIDN